MSLLAVATVLLVLVAIAATYFVARATRAIVAIREDAADARKQAKVVLKQAQKAEASSVRVADKLYRLTKTIEEMLADPTVQRALRKEGRQ